MMLPTLGWLKHSLLKADGFLFGWLSTGGISTDLSFDSVCYFPFASLPPISLGFSCEV